MVMFSVLYSNLLKAQRLNRDVLANKASSCPISYGTFNILHKPKMLALMSSAVVK